MSAHRAGWRRGRRAVARLVVGVLVTSGAVVVPTGPAGAAAGPDLPGWVAALAGDGDDPDPAPPVPWRESSSTPLGRSRPAPAAAATFPEPDSWRVRPGEAADPGAPVQVSTRAGAPVRVEVLDRATARRVGASGFVFTVSGDPDTLTVDYSGFAGAYGAGYADRLRVVSLPGCSLAVPVPAGCEPAGVRQPARNDLEQQELVVDVAGAEVGEPAVFAVTSGVGSDQGTFAATPLSVAGSWQVTPGSGEFSYSYPVDVPVPAGGSAPSVGLSYSSGVVDGLTLASNTQASPTGLGWSDFANAFIERRYEPCFRNLGTADLCWKSDNATLSLAGVSGPLVPVDEQHTQWRVLSDPGWRVERLTGAAHTTIHQQQYWRVTGPDGTVYYFGYGHMPGRQTNSILGVPVIADNSGEPCRAPGDEVGGCEQGWRWYLDRVEDPDGNVQSLLYQRETNWYHSALGALGGQPMTSYHRGALLKEIIYGGQGWDAGNYAARVRFGLQWRCGFLVEACPAPTRGHTGFPDVPTDLICARNSTCDVHAPSFFVGRRYSHVRTDVRVGDEWRPVAQHNLYHSFGEGGNGVARKLQLVELQHAATAFGKLNAYPATSFTYDWLDNRVDHDGQIPKAMRHNRIVRVTNPFGGRIEVTYGRNRPCPRDYDPWPRWDQNSRDCFPQSVKDGDFTRTGVFNKYLVTSVAESAGVGAPAMVTSYSYEGTPAWAFDTGAFARDEDETGWSVWRGYGTTTITQGNATTQLRLFRGWHGDPTLVQDAGGDWVPLGSREVQVRSFDGSASHTDHRALAGQVLQERELGTLDGVPGIVLQSRRHEYERRITHDPGEDYLFDAEWVGLASTTETVAAAVGVPRQRRSQTTYNEHFQPISTYEEGWLDTSGDERCSITTYADNPDAGMVVYPAVNKTVAGDCDSTEVLSLTETYYDGSGSLGAPPTRGNPTRQRTLVEPGRWSQTTTEYDELGRPVVATDPNGAATTTRYAVTPGSPATQIPTRITVTDPLGHQSVTDFHPEFGVPKREQDANGNVTERWYDEFGRLTAIWLPTEPVAFAEPSYRFSYDLPNRAVWSRRLVSDARCCEDAVFEDTWVIHDGFWRERQVQGRSPASGKVLVTETTYDSNGRLRDETVEQALAGTPGRYLPGGSSWANRTRHSYDELGREVRKEWLRGGSVAHATVTSYGADTVTVTGPDGRAVRERIDGLGRTVAVAERDGQDWVSSSYRYDLADRLVSVSDPAGNRIDYTSNLAGWRTSQQDPNRGSATFGYDDAGNQIRATDALGNQVHTGYDALGRLVERRAGSPTGPLLASWEYDTAPGGKGMPHRTLTHTAEGTWVAQVLGYDSKGRASGERLVVPDGIPGLSGSYDLTRTYDRADRVRSVTYPAVGGLPAEEVTTDYDDLGLATGMAGLEQYVWGVSHDDRGRVVSAGFGPRPDGATWLARNWTYDVDQRLNGSQTFVAGAGAPEGVVSAHELRFDPAGNLTEKVTRQDGLAWRECFGYDARSRLTAAHTVAATTTCADGTPGTGDRPYAHGYAYSPDGRLLERVEDGASTGYAYPEPGSPRPHAPTAVGADAYTWDAAGNLTSRTGAGRTETFAWDVQGRLASVTGPGGETSFVYDASGQRLLRRAPDGTATLYLAGHEVTASADGSSVTAVRTYTFDGQVVATRGPAGVDYLVSDPAGSVELAVPSGGQPSATRAYAPYGRVRAQEGELATDRGFLGQIEDAGTGLSYLNARYYDAAAGLFISTDPVYDTAKVKTLNPYTYSAGNPTTFADPSGLYSSYTWGLEVENSQLRGQNKQLRAHIRRLGNHIESLQDIIRKQQKQINKLVTYARALEAEIARQASIIRRLQARVAYLERVVVAQQREISRLRWVVARQQQIIRYQAGVIRYQAGVIRYQAGVISYQAGVISYQRGVITGLVHEAIAPEYQQTVLASIFSGTGIPVRMVNSFNLETLRNDGPLVPATWNGEPEILGSRRVAAEWDASILQGGLSAAETQISRLEFESSYHEAVRDELHAELHSTDFWSMACDTNSIAGGAYSLAGGGNPYISGVSAGFSIYCAVR